MLIFACVALTAATGLLIEAIPLLYFIEDMTFQSSLQGVAIDESTTLRSQRMFYSHMAMTWTTIFAVKICFLFYFLQMVDRLKKLMFIWKIVFGITVVSYGYCICSVFISCPRFGLVAAGKLGLSLQRILFRSEEMTMVFVCGCSEMWTTRWFHY